MASCVTYKDIFTYKELYLHEEYTRIYLQKREEYKERKEKLGRRLDGSAEVQKLQVI